MNADLKHWYDGRFYDFFIAPNQDRAFEQVIKFIKDGSTLLDAGCSTGRFCFQAALKCSSIDGIDASGKNIDSANKKPDLKIFKNISFHHTGIKTFLEGKKIKYDYSLLSYVIHEIDENERAGILNLLSSYSDKLIIVDYLAPHPKNLTGKINRIVEFLAGKKHNKNFKSYLENEGIAGLARQTNLKILEEIKDNPPAAHIAVFSKK
jgi:hypothetical protein